MVKRCIGIDMSSSCLCALQIARTGEQFLVEKVFSAQTRRSTDLPSQILKQLINQHGFDRRAEVAISMSHDTVFFRNLEADCADCTSALRDLFPIPSDEIVTQVYSHRKLSDGKFSVLAAATSKKSLREKLDILANAKINPKLVDAPIFAIHSAVVVNHPQVVTGIAIIAYINESYLALAVTQDGNILAVRNIPIIFHFGDNTDMSRQQLAQLLSREVEITWQKVFRTEIEPDCKIYLVASGSVSAHLDTLIEENLHCNAFAVDPFTKIKTLPDDKADQSTSAAHNAQYAIAEGLALRILAPEKTKGVNFLQADYANIKPSLNLKKELQICAALLCAIVGFCVAGLFMQLSRLETNYAQINNETTEVFQSTLPQEKNIVSPLVQLEQKLQSFREDYQLFASFRPDSLSPLEVLHSLTIHKPSQANVKVDDLLIAADTVRINGTCDSFESVYQWQRLLREVPAFTMVEVQDVQKQPQGTVSFTLLLSSAETEQK